MAQRKSAEHYKVELTVSAEIHAREQGILQKLHAISADHLQALRLHDRLEIADGQKTVYFAVIGRTLRIREEESPIILIHIDYPVR